MYVVYKLVYIGTHTCGLQWVLVAGICKAIDSQISHMIYPSI